MFKKLLLVLSLATIAMQSNAMWLRKPMLNALTKRATVLRAPAIVRSQVACSKAVVPYVKPQQAVLIRRANASLSMVQKAKSHNGSASFNASSIKRLVGAGLALGAVCATAQEALCEGDKAKDETAVPIYQGPFEESRKKFYASLEAKPWGEVSKKYIKALQEEEQKLMEEFFEVMKVDKEVLERNKIKTGSVIDLLVEDHASKINIFYENVPKNLLFEFKELFEKSHISPANVRIGWVIKGQFHMEAFHDSIAIDCGILSHYDSEAYAKIYSFCPDFFKAAALHEIQHLLHHDSIHRQAFVRVLNDASDTVSLSTQARIFLMMGQNIALKYMRFTEKRADICAGLIDPKYALAAANELSSVRDSHDNISHPAFSERAAYMNQLHKEMTEAIAKNDAQSR